MKEHKASNDTQKKSNVDVVALLERMLADCKILCGQDDPVLKGQMQVVLAVLADVLEVKDPQHHFEHVVEYE